MNSVKTKSNFPDNSLPQLYSYTGDAGDGGNSKQTKTSFLV